MNNFKLLLKKDLLEIKRGKAWLVYLIVFSAIAIISALTAKFIPKLIDLLLGEDAMGGLISANVGYSYTQFISNVGEIFFFVIALISVTCLLKEKTSGTYYVLKSNGVKDREIIFSHYLTKLLLVTASFIVSGLVFFLTNLILFKEYTGIHGFVAFLYMYLYLVFSLTLSVFVSSFIKKRSAGYIIVIVVYFLLTILAIIPKINVGVPYYGLTIANAFVNQTGEIKVYEYIVNASTSIAFIAIMLVLTNLFYTNKIDNRKEEK